MPSTPKTVRLVKPSSGEIFCARIQKINKTSVKIEDGCCLCEDFLDGRCERGIECCLAHVEKRDIWSCIVPRTVCVYSSERGAAYVYEQGFQLQCFSADQYTFYKDIPSHYLLVTEGSGTYIAAFNNEGANFKEKLTLCSSFTPALRAYCAGGYTGSCLTLGAKLLDFCPAGMKCPHIHVALPNSSSVQQNQTHIASLKAIQDCHYERLPASVQVYVYIPPNRRKTQSETTLFPGDSVLRTVGATQYEEVFTRNGCEVPQSATFQHCIHFIQNKMCRLGAECNFLHIIQEELLQSTTPEATPYPTEVEGPSSNHAALMAASDFLGRESPVYRAEGRTPVATPVPRRSSPTRIVVELPDTSQLPAAPPPQPSGRVSPTGRVSPSGRVSPKRNNPYQLSPMSEPLA